MRLFIAIPLENEAARMVTDVQRTFRRQNVRGNYMPEENLHITLAFIGEYNDPEAVLAAMERVRFAPFSITVDHVGCFDDLWWAGLAESKPLDALARNLRHALAEANIPFDKKRFRPHVTFLRHADRLGPRVNVPKQLKPTRMAVTGISLMLSTQGKNGMIYTELGYIAAE